MLKNLMTLRFQIHLQYLLFCSVLIALFLTLYQGVIVHTLNSWMTQEGSHGPLILIVSTSLIWIKRNEIRNSQMQPAILKGGLLLGGGCFIYFVGELGTTILVQQVSMIPVLLGIILLLAGFSLFKILLVPVAYLMFMTGLLETVLASIAIYLQMLTAWLAALFFQMIGWPVFRDNLIIELPHISLWVARGCSGISHIISLLALAVPLAQLTQKNRTKKIILVFSAIVIGLFANGLRVALIGIYTYYFEGVDIHGPYETLYVSFIFFFGLIALLLFSRALNKGIITPRNNGRGESGKNNPQLLDSFAAKKPCHHKRLASFSVVVLILATTVGFSYWYTPQPVEMNYSFDEIPQNIVGFIGKNLESMDEDIRPFPADVELMRLYEDHNNGERITLYIGYFEIQDRNRKIIDYRRAWMHQDAVSFRVQEGETKFTINKKCVENQAEPSCVYFWYAMNGKVIRNQYMGKFLTFINSFFNRKNNASVIVISSKSKESEITPFIVEIFQIVKRYN